MFRYNLKKNFIFLKDYIKKADEFSDFYNKKATNPFENKTFRENTYIWVEKPNSS